MTARFEAALNILLSNEAYGEAAFDEVNTAPYKLAPNGIMYGTLVALTTDTALNASPLTKPTFIALKNLDKSNYVTVAYKAVGGSGAVQTSQIPPGGIFAVPDWDSSLSTPMTLTGNGSHCRMQYIIAQDV